VLEDVDVGVKYTVGGKVRAEFVGANPRNNLRLEGTFLAVDYLSADGQWVMVRSDSHPSTTFEWSRVSEIAGTSRVKVEWTIENNTPPGTYRLRYFGDAKSVFGKVEPFVGTSSNFAIA